MDFKICCEVGKDQKTNDEMVDLSNIWDIEGKSSRRKIVQHLNDIRTIEINQNELKWGLFWSQKSEASEARKGPPSDLDFAPERPYLGMLLGVISYFELSHACLKNINICQL